MWRILWRRIRSKIALTRRGKSRENRRLTKRGKSDHGERKEQERQNTIRGPHDPARPENRRKRNRGKLTNHHCPCHIPRRLPKQPNRRIRNLPHSPKPPERNPLRSCLQIFLSRQPLQSLRTADAPWCNDVGGDASRTEFQGDVGGEGVDTGFSDSYVRLEWSASVVDCGGDEDYAATEGGR